MYFFCRRASINLYWPANPSTCLFQTEHTRQEETRIQQNVTEYIKKDCNLIIELTRQETNKFQWAPMVQETVQNCRNTPCGLTNFQETSYVLQSFSV